MISKRLESLAAKDDERKVAINYQAAWELLQTPKALSQPQRVEQWLDEWGVYEADHLAYLSEDDLASLQGCLKRASLSRFNSALGLTASSARLADPPRPSTSGRKLILSKSFARDGAVSSGQSRVVDGRYTDGSQLLTGELIWHQIKVKLTDSSANAVPSDAAKELEFLQCLDATQPGFFVRPFGLLTANEIQVEGSDERVECVALVMEKGLTTLAEDLHLTHYDLGMQIRITLRLMEIMCAAHACQITLMDFKGSNVVFFNTPHSIHPVLKGIDLDGSLLTGTPLNDCQFAGTVAYMAPELVTQPKDKLFANPQLDIWSLGMVVFHVFAKSTFWMVQGLVNDDQIVQKMKSPAFTQASIDATIDKQFHDNDSLRHFLRDVIVVDPAARASLTALRSRALMTGGNSVSASTIFNAFDYIVARVDDIKQSMKTLMTLTENGFLQTNEGIQSFASAGFAFSATTDTMLDTFVAMQSSCSQILLTMPNASSLAELIASFNEFQAAMGGSLEGFKSVTDDSVLSRLQQQDTNMMTGFNSILAALQDSTSRSVLEHSELSGLVAVLSEQVAGVGKGVSSIIVLTEGMQRMQYDLLTGLRSVQQEVYLGTKDKQEALSGLQAVERSLSAEVAALGQRVVEGMQQASGDSAASNAALRADMLGLLRQQAQVCQDGGLDEVRSILLTILKHTESQAASPVNTASVIHMLADLKDSVATVVSDLQEVKVEMRTLSVQLCRQTEMLMAVVTSESQVPVLFFLSVEAPSTKLDKLKSLFRVCTVALLVMMNECVC